MVGAAALTACGGDSSEVSADQESDLNAITQVGRDMEAAFAQRDAERFCSFVDPGKEDFARHLRRLLTRIWKEG